MMEVIDQYEHCIGPQVNSIKSVINDLIKLGNTKEKAFDLVLDYLAYNLSINQSYLCAKIQEREILERINIDTLKQIEWDVIGTVYEEIFKVTLSEYVFNEERRSKIELKLKDGIVKSAYIRNCETGRVMYRLREINKNIRLFCIESELVYYKIALINLTLHHLPCKILFSKVQMGKNITSPSTFKDHMCNIWI